MAGRVGSGLQGMGPPSVGSYLCLRLPSLVLLLRGNIIRTVLYIGNVLPLQWAQLTETFHTARLGLEFAFLFFRLHDLSLCWCMFRFTLDS